MSRKTAREVAMKLTFACLSGGEDTYDEILDKSNIDEAPTLDDMQYLESIMDGLNEHADDIDAIIKDVAIGWKVERMPRVDLSIMRIAIFEILYREDIPCSVSINEAVELAKRFGGERSAAYINGMLGTLARKLENGEPVRDG